MITHVRVDHPEGQLWVANPNASGPRRERVLSVADPLSTADLQRRARSFMATLDDVDSLEAQPGVGAVPGVDFNVGDWVDVDGENLRCVDLRRQLDRNSGEWQPPTPVFSTPTNLRLLQADRAFDRLIALQAGGAPDASIMADALLRPAERFESMEVLRWSWYDPADPGSRDVLDDNTRWQTVKIGEACRATAITCTADFSGATGNTIIELHRNGSLWNGLFNLTLPASSGGFNWRIVWMWGYETLDEGDEISIRSITNGQHRQGNYELHLWPTI